MGMSGMMLVVTMVDSDGNNEKGNDEGGNYKGCTFGAGTNGDGAYTNGATGDDCNGPYDEGCAATSSSENVPRATTSVLTKYALCQTAHRCLSASFSESQPGLGPILNRQTANES